MSMSIDWLTLTFPIYPKSFDEKYNQTCQKKANSQLPVLNVASV